MPEVNKTNLSAPPSQKDANAGTTDTNANANKTPKVESTGAVKDTSGNTVAADKSANSPNKSGVITGDKAPPSKESPEDAARKAAEAQKTGGENTTSNEPFEKTFSSIKGEVLQGDAFRITLKRGNKTIRMPVPIEGSNNIVVLQNTFKLIEEMLNVGTEKELDEKFHSFVE